jgi:hypothetical protein
MQSPQQVLQSQIYLPAVVPIVGTFKHSYRKVALARLETPNQLCGVAQRVGYTGTLATDLAIYRLKVRQSPDHRSVLLPGFFVFEEGVFRAYQDASETFQHE